MIPRQSYIVVESRYFLHEGPRISYGIALVETEGEEDIILQTVCDISPDRRRVSELVGLCNRIQPTREGLMELLEEFLGEGKLGVAPPLCQHVR